MSVSKAHSNLSLSGNWQDAGDTLNAFLVAGFRLEYARLPGTHRDHLHVHSSTLCVVALADEADILHDQVTWLAWARTSDPALTLKAYQAGARAVFPPETPPELLVRALAQIAEPPVLTEHPEGHRRYERGDLIFLEVDSALEVIDGVLATMMIHKDGAEVLLGLSGAGQILIAHPDDECHIQFLAHTPTTVHIQPWGQIVHRPDFPEKLRARLQQMEGWAAMQARPHLDQRLLGILGLLAEQFGKPCDDGVLIDIRITHSHLAAAVGATRTTITRVLGDLRTTGKLTIVENGGKDCFCLCERNVNAPHHFYRVLRN